MAEEQSKDQSGRNNSEQAPSSSQRSQMAIDARKVPWKTKMGRENFTSAAGDRSLPLCAGRLGRLLLTTATVTDTTSPYISLQLSFV